MGGHFLQNEDVELCPAIWSDCLWHLRPGLWPRCRGCSLCDSLSVASLRTPPSRTGYALSASLRLPSAAWAMRARRRFAMTLPINSLGLERERKRSL
jgi:hypothetical protein